MDQTDLTAAPHPGETLLDPFGYMPGIASGIEGLGGDQPSEHDQNYVFHTDYVEVGEGPTGFVVRFQGLTAKRGSIQLRVHMVGDSGRAVLINSARIQLNRLVAMNGQAELRFDGYRGVRFALYGGLVGDTDAHADGLAIALDRSGHTHAVEDVVTEARNTHYRREDIHARAHILSLARPALAEPVCQPGTETQLNEASFRGWTSKLALGDASPRTQWAHAYVLQALDRYGMLQKGAHGLGFGPDAAALEEALRETGADLTISEIPDAPQSLARRLVNFDFLWSIDVAQRFGTAAIGQWFIETALRCLRPGGIAIHVVPYDGFATQRGDAPVSDLLFGRADIERIALGMISRNHEIAQVKIGAPDLLYDTIGGTSVVGAAFGIIARKGSIPHGS